MKCSMNKISYVCKFYFGEKWLRKKEKRVHAQFTITYGKIHGTYITENVSEYLTFHFSKSVVYKK